LTTRYDHSGQQPEIPGGHPSGQDGGAFSAEGAVALSGSPDCGIAVPAAASGGQNYPVSGFEAEDAGVILRTTRYRRRGKRRWLYWLLAPLLLIAGAGVSGFFYVDHRLAQGPIELPSLGARIAASLSERAGKGYRFVIGKSFLQKTTGRPAVTLDSLKVFGEDGAVILSAPNAVVSLDWLSLLSGAVRPRRLAVSGLDLHVSVAADGSLSVSAGRTRLNLTGPGPGAVPHLRGTSVSLQPSSADAVLPKPSAQVSAGKIVAAALTNCSSSLAPIHPN